MFIQFQAFIKLWKEKQSKLKLDMVFATMSVIKQWDSAKVWIKVLGGIILLYVNRDEVSLRCIHVWYNSITDSHTKKNIFPDGESNPGHGGESAGS